MSASSSRRALLVCQAGPLVGEGHHARVRVAASALRRADAWRVEVRACAPDEEVAPVIDGLFATDRFQLLVLDLPPRALSPGLVASISRWRAQQVKIVGIDSLIALRDLLDGVFMPAFRLDPALAAHGSPVPLTYGWDCFLLDERYAPRPWSPGPRVLVLTGGSDATGLGRTWPALLDAVLPIHAEVDWVTGPHAQGPTLPTAPRIARFTEHVAPRGLHDLMQSCHIAATLHGITLFELLSVGVPTVVFSPYGSKDEAELRELAALGVARVARDERDATRTLASLLEEPAEASTLAHRARTFLGTGGGARFAAWVEELFA